MNAKRTRSWCRVGGLGGVAACWQVFEHAGQQPAPSASNRRRHRRHPRRHGDGNSRDSAANDTAAKKLPPEALQALVAPIALYPDPLLAQTLAASTYPLEIVQLHQYMLKYPKLKDQALVDSIKKQPWDPIIQSMAAVPEVVKRLHDDIQWTTDLGNAFLAQQSEVMDAVQVMRKKAKDKGALESNEQQKVEVQVVESKQVIVVESANPEVIYVPSYNPTYVYGPAPYAYYPYPPVYYPPYYAGAAFVSFGIGMMWGAAMWGGVMLLRRLGWRRQRLHQQLNNFSAELVASVVSVASVAWVALAELVVLVVLVEWVVLVELAALAVLASLVVLVVLAVPASLVEWWRWWRGRAVAARGRTTLRIEVERRTATGQLPTSLVDPRAAMSACGAIGDPASAQAVVERAIVRRAETSAVARGTRLGRGAGAGNRGSSGVGSGAGGAGGDKVGNRSIPSDRGSGSRSGSGVGSSSGNRGVSNALGGRSRGYNGIERAGQQFARIIQHGLPWRWAEGHVVAAEDGGDDVYRR